MKKKENKKNKIETKDKKEQGKDLIKKGKSKSEKFNGIIQIIKKKWLFDTTKTFLLVAIIIAVFIGISVFVQKQNFTPIDLTEEKLFTLTDDSKEKIKDIDKLVDIYFIGYEENDTSIDLAKQYTKVNKNIQVEAVTATSRPDLVEKYGIDSNSKGILIESGERYKVLSEDDLYTYDQETFDTIDVTEEKLTAAIRTIISDDIPKIYFLTGNSDFSLSTSMTFLDMYLQNEVNEVSEIDLLTTGSVPDDCNTLVITTPKNDFDEMTTNAIINYINKGGNILWLNAVNESKDFANVNKILEMYGIEPFEFGAIREKDSSKMVFSEPSFILPEISQSKVTEKLSNNGVILVNSNKINLMSEDKLEQMNITKTDLLNSSESSYYVTDFSDTTNQTSEGKQEGSFIIGAQMDKVITEKSEEDGTEEVKSKLIIFAENYFASDFQLSNMQVPLITLGRQNKDLVLNSIAYLSDREEDMTVRKSKNEITFTPTDKENKIILIVIAAVPLIIILIGMIVWRKRRRKN